MKYEAFVAEPGDIMADIYHWCGLPQSDYVTRRLKNMATLENMNKKYFERTTDEINEMNMIMGDLLRELGY